MSLQGLLEPVARKRARPVLRGPRRSNAPGLPDERWFRELTDKALRRGVFHSVPDLIASIEEYLDAHIGRVYRDTLARSRPLTLRRSAQ